MAFSRVNNGIYCAGFTETQTIDIDGDTTETDSAISSDADVIFVMMAGSDCEGTPTSFTIDVGDGTNSDAMTEEFYFEEDFGDHVQVFRFFRSQLTNISDMSDIIQFELTQSSCVSAGTVLRSPLTVRMAIQRSWMWMETPMPAHPIRSH